MLGVYGYFLADILTDSTENENFNKIEISNPSRTGKPSAEKRVTHIVAQFF